MKYAYIIGLVLALGNVVSAMPTDGSEIDKALEQTNTSDPQVPEVKLDENKDKPAEADKESKKPETEVKPEPAAEEKKKPETEAETEAEAEDKPKDANTSSNVVIQKTKRKIDESPKPEESKDKPKQEEKPSAPDAKAPEAPATSSPAAIYPTPPEKSPAPEAPATSSPAAIYPTAPEKSPAPEAPATSSPAAIHPKAPEKSPAPESPAPVYPTLPEKSPAPEAPATSSPAAIYPTPPEKSPAPNATVPEKPAQSSPAVKPVPEKPKESAPAEIYPVAPEKPKEPTPAAPNATVPEKPAQSSPAVYPVVPEKPKESAPAEIYPVAPEKPKESAPVHPPQAPQADKPLNGTEFTPVYQLPNHTAPQVPEVPVYPLSDSGNFTNAADYAASQIKSIGGSEEQVKLAVECAEKAMQKVNVTSKASAVTIGKAVTEAIQQQKTPEQIQKIAQVAAMNAAVTETHITISVTTVKTKVTNIIQQLGGNEQECQAAADAAQYAATKVYETCVPCAKDKGTAKSIYKAITNVYKNKGSAEEMKTAAVAAATSYSSVYSKVQKQTSTSTKTNTVNRYDTGYSGSETQTSTGHYSQPSAQADAPAEEQYQPAYAPNTETVTEQTVAADDYPKSEVMTLMKQAGCTEEDCKLGVQIVETVQKEYNAHSAECVSKISYAVAYSYGSGGSQDDLWSSARTAASTCSSTSTSTVTDQAATQTGTETSTYHQSPQLNTDVSTATQTETQTNKVLPVLPPPAQANADVEQPQPLRQRLPVLPPSSGEISNSVYGSPAINFKPADSPKMSQYSKGYSPDGTCGPQSAGNWMCRPGSCCSVYGHCGNTIEFCGRGCQASFGNCLISGPSESTCLCTDSQTKLQRVETFLGGTTTGTATQTNTETYMDKNFTGTNTQTGTYNVNGYQHPKYPATVEEDDDEEETEEPSKNATQNYLDALGEVLEGKQN